jgi:hypothetical protein
VKRDEVMDKVIMKIRKTLVVGIGLLIGAAMAAIGQSYVKVQQGAEGVSAPALVTVTNTSVVTVFGSTTNDSVTAGRVLFRSIQNVGTVPILYRINSTNVSVTNYHGVIAGGTTNRDGLGSVLDLSRIRWPVSLRTEGGGGQVSVVELTQ